MPVDADASAARKADPLPVPVVLPRLVPIEEIVPRRVSRKSMRGSHPTSARLGALTLARSGMIAPPGVGKIRGKART